MRESRSPGRRRLTARLPVLLPALTAALAALLPGGVGQAQTGASLIEVEGGGTQIAFDGERALGFETAERGQLQLQEVAGHPGRLLRDERYGEAGW